MSTSNTSIGDTPSGARLDFKDVMDYGDYLGFDNLLNAQRPQTHHQNELLFIIQHQTSELWMKLLVAELLRARENIRRDDLQPCFKIFTRAGRIFEQLISAWSVLSTLTPSEYLEFRDALGHSSGFQSHQYRILEFLLGNKRPEQLAVHRDRPERWEAVSSIYYSPSIYDEVISLLARRGFSIEPNCLDRDWTARHTFNQSVLDAWISIYGDTSKNWELYQLAEKLVDLEDSLRVWRFRHVTTVERIIGFKRGTGGTAGVPYLRAVLDIELFPELWRLRTSI